MTADGFLARDKVCSEQFPGAPELPCVATVQGITETRWFVNQQVRSAVGRFNPCQSAKEMKKIMQENLKGAADSSRLLYYTV
jgi:endo-beta-N-acetylglucosaminidase D